MHATSTTHSVSPAPDPRRHPVVPPALARIPNLLTVSRLVFAAMFFSALELAQRPIHDKWWLLSAAAIFIVGSLTDALDGYLARRWNVVTVFGRVMDPVADKVLVIGAFIYLAGPAFLTTVNTPSGPRASQATSVEPWMVVVILARELLVTSLRGVLEASGVDFSASFSGKAKMAVQSVAVPCILLLVALGSALSPAGVELPRPPMDPAILYSLKAIAWVTVTVTVLSAVPYVARAVRFLKLPAPPPG